MKTKDYVDGYKDAVQKAITWLEINLGNFPDSEKKFWVEDFVGYLNFDD